MFKYRIVRLVCFLLIGAGIGATIGYFQAQEEMEGDIIKLSPDSSVAAVIKRPTRVKTDETSNGQALKSDIGGPFELIDHTGKAVSDADYSNTYKLVFFGFTYCPAICPTELQKITQILNTLEAETAAKITPLFITIDPERDTVEELQQYVEQFHPRLIGLTGSLEQIDAVKKAYRVYASKVENDMMDEYMVDHSSFLYLMTKDNKMIALYPSKDSAAQIVSDIQKRSL